MRNEIVHSAVVTQTLVAMRQALLVHEHFACATKHDNSLNDTETHPSSSDNQHTKQAFDTKTSTNRYKSELLKHIFKLIYLNNLLKSKFCKLDVVRMLYRKLETRREQRIDVISSQRIDVIS